MGGQHRDTADDGSYGVTIGSVDDPAYPSDSYFISQQDSSGKPDSKVTSIFDSNDTLLGESYGTGSL